MALMTQVPATPGIRRRNGRFRGAGISGNGGNRFLSFYPYSDLSCLMKSDLIEKASKVVPHPPQLINMVSRRVRQLNQGRAPLINTAAYGYRLGQGDIALIEIIEGKITAEFPGEEEA